MKPDAHTTEEIEATIKKLAKAYKVRSLKDFMECFAPDEDVVIIGTGSDEKRIGTDQIRAQVERDWAQTESLEISVDWKSLSAAGAVAWAAVEGAFKVRAGGPGMGSSCSREFCSGKAWRQMAYCSLALFNARSRTGRRKICLTLF